VKSPSSYFHVIRLQDNTALFYPITLQIKDDRLKIGAHEKSEPNYDDAHAS